MFNDNFDCGDPIVYNLNSRQIGSGSMTSVPLRTGETNILRFQAEP